MERDHGENGDTAKLINVGPIVQFNTARQTPVRRQVPSASENTQHSAFQRRSADFGLK
jgi:hypothetical protein